MALEAVIRDMAPQDKTTLRHAMLSIYHRSLGRQLELRGAPAVLLPPEVRPLGLAEALELLSGQPATLQDAVWRIVRGVPVPRSPDDQVEGRYPPELLSVMSRQKLVALDKHRRDRRIGAQLFAAALVACAEKRWPELQQLAGLLDNQAGRDGPSDFSQAIVDAFGMSAKDYLEALAAPKNQKKASDEIIRLEDEVGLNLNDFVEEFADAVAFIDFINNFQLWQADSGATVYPVSSVIRQDSTTLTTTATVTTLIHGEFDTLRTAIDPQCWPLCSDVIRKARRVNDAFKLDFTPQKHPIQVGEGWDKPRLFLEEAAISWGGDANQQASFHNVLSIDKFSIREEDKSIELEFSLSRSISSRVLWDDRAGGILINEGYIKARQLVKDLWRVTSRKILKFSDRTPISNRPESPDFGQMLNYLSPAALMWWLESEMSSTGWTVYSKMDQVQKALEDHLKGEADGQRQATA